MGKWALLKTRDTIKLFRAVSFPPMVWCVSG